jgi:NAD(P)-dependent dehydrogenase (short-subunit alcohol dehydrogenase family)
MNRLDGKVALISGAARGIGAETARLMIEAGAKVAVADVLDERGRETVRALEGAGGDALYLPLDVTSEEAWSAAVAAILARFGKLDILVNNAGLFLGKDIESASLAEWQRLSAVNLTGVFLGTKLALPALREAARESLHGSAIVNLASVAGLVGSTQDPLYSMTKGGVTLFTNRRRSNSREKATASGSIRCIPARSIPTWATRCWSQGRAISAPTTSRWRAARSSTGCRSAAWAPSPTSPKASSFSPRTTPPS